MTFRVLKSQLGADVDAFPARVEAFRQARLAHHATIGEPAPCEHDLVESCVRRVPQEGEADDYVADYVIVDDTPAPPAPPTLRERKDALLHDIAQREGALMTASMPQGKRRLHAMLVHEAAVKPEAERSDEENALLAEHRARLGHEAAIARHAAMLMAQVEDLTEDTIASWKGNPFPE